MVVPYYTCTHGEKKSNETHKLILTWDMHINMWFNEIDKLMALTPDLGQAHKTSSNFPIHKSSIWLYFPWNKIKFSSHCSHRTCLKFYLIFRLSEHIVIDNNSNTSLDEISTALPNNDYKAQIGTLLQTMFPSIPKSSIKICFKSKNHVIF